MNRLQRELRRLYAPRSDNGAGLAPDAPSLIDGQERVRAVVLELARPADWAVLAAVWAGVQTDLALPAPAIAVNGSDGLQLWFSLLEPLPAPQARAFVGALCRHYLGDIAPARVALLPGLDALPGEVPDAPSDAASDAASARQPRHARPVPALQPASGRWSAFVASDLVPMFADEPWLDLPPNPDGQAQLLAPLRSIAPVELALAMQRLDAAGVPAAPGLASVAASKAAAFVDPRRFLLEVMNDDSLDLALRIEAAKALLPGFDAGRGPQREPGAS